MRITIDLNEDEVKKLNRRAKKNLLDLKAQIEDIIRRSCINLGKTGVSDVKVDDSLVNIFSRRKKR